MYFLRVISVRVLTQYTSISISHQARLFTNRRGSQKHTIKRVPRVHVKDWDAPANAPYRLGRTAFVLEGALPPTGAYAESAFAAWNASFFINRYPHEVVDHYSTNMARFFPLLLRAKLSVDEFF